MQAKLLITLLLTGLVAHFIVRPQPSTAQSTSSGIPGTGGGECPTYQWYKYGTILDSSVMTECGSCTVPQITGYTKVCKDFYRATYGSNVSISYTYNRVMCKNCSLCKGCNALDPCDEDEGNSCTETLASGDPINCPEYVVSPEVVAPKPPATILPGTDLAPCETGAE